MCGTNAKGAFWKCPPQWSILTMSSHAFAVLNIPVGVGALILSFALKGDIEALIVAMLGAWCLIGATVHD
jgi:hypothetical protein